MACTHNKYIPFCEELYYGRFWYVNPLSVRKVEALCIFRTGNHWKSHSLAFLHSLTGRKCRLYMYMYKTYKTFTSQLDNNRHKHKLKKGIIPIYYTLVSLHVARFWLAISTKLHEILVCCFSYIIPTDYTFYICESDLIPTDNSFMHAEVTSPNTLTSSLISFVMANQSLLHYQKKI